MSKHTIVGNKVGLVINLMIDGNVIQKKCDTPELADTFFKLVNDAKKGSDVEYLNLMTELNRINRILIKGILETDQTGQYYLQGFNHPVPQLLVDTILEYLEKDYPIEAIVNFWKLLMLNPDKVIRDTLFDFLSQYKFAITDHGYFTAYKVVQHYSEGITDDALITLVTEKYQRVKANKKSPKNYSVLYNALDKKYITVLHDEDKLNEGYETIGNLADLYTRIESGAHKTVYTDKHNQTTRIILGQPVRKERRHEAHSVECSDNGLHVGSTSYVTTFYRENNVVIMVLINPAHVIHVPKSESTKLRTAEYYPYALLEVNKEATIDNFHKYKTLDQPYFETDYATFEKAKIEQDLEQIRNSEAAAAGNSIPQEQLDYKKILEQRLVDLNAILHK
jgi:hypothetical protein